MLFLVKKKCIGKVDWEIKLKQLAFTLRILLIEITNCKVDFTFSLFTCAIITQNLKKNSSKPDKLIKNIKIINPY